MAQDKFMFFPNFKAMADKLDSESRLAFYDALTDYVFFDKEPSDPIISALIEAIKPSLNKIDGRRTNGGNHNPNGVNQHSKSGQSGQIRSKLVNSGQSLSETETETETETKEKTIKKKKTILSVEDINLGECEIIRPQVKKWLEYKHQERGERYKTEMSLMACVKKLYKLSDGDPIKADEIVENSIANRYQGFVPLKGSSPSSVRMSFKDMREMQKEIEIQKVLRGEL